MPTAPLTRSPSLPSPTPSHRLAVSSLALTLASGIAPWRHIPNALIVCGVVVVMASSGAITPAAAYDIAGSSAVTVDSNVLDAMGPTLTLPDLMLAPEARPHQPTASMGATSQGQNAGQQLRPDPAAPPKSRLMGPLANSAPLPPRRAPQVTVLTKPASSTPYQSYTAPSPAPTYTPPAQPAQTAPAPAPTVAAPQAPAPVISTPAQGQAPTPAPTRAPAVTFPPTATPVAAQPAKPAAPVTMASAPAAPPPAAAPAAAAEQTASLPPPVVRASGLSLSFGENDTSVPSGSTASLDQVAARLNSDPSLAVRVEAYASGGSAGKSRARRLSLSRALAVRSYLLDKGIDANRVEVRALGTPDSGNADRVDIGWVSG